MRGSSAIYHPTFRTQGSELFINPLMGLYWAFGLEQVARRCLYLDEIQGTETWGDMKNAISPRFACPHCSDTHKEWEHLADVSVPRRDFLSVIEKFNDALTIRNGAMRQHPTKYTGIVSAEISQPA